jgi:succinate-semialdehyde dehydrogenase/glutarate-semialdehyde dehydrogenase
VEGLMAAKFRNGGQTCVCPNRVFVHAPRARCVRREACATHRRLKVGPASDPTSQIGPMINARAVDKIERHVRDASARCARGRGRRATSALGRNYFAPTLLTGADATMACAMRRDVRPGGTVTRFQTSRGDRRRERDAVTGWRPTFYSQDVRRIWRVAEALEAGLVGINEGASSRGGGALRGVKESGYGREGSVHGLDDYIAIESTCARVSW